MTLRKQASKPTLPPGSEGRDHLGGVSIILRAVVFALEEELELGSEVSDSSLVPQQGILPGHSERRIPSVDPTLLVAFADRDVEAPRLVRRLTAPYVVLAGLRRGYRPVPRREAARCSDLDVPACQHHRQSMDVSPQDADVAVMMRAPGTPYMQLQGNSTADPPACWPPVEDLDQVAEPEWLPWSKFVFRHARPSVGGSAALRRHGGVVRHSGQPALRADDERELLDPCHVWERVESRHLTTKVKCPATTGAHSA